MYLFIGLFSGIVIGIIVGILLWEFLNSKIIGGRKDSTGSKMV